MHSISDAEKARIVRSLVIWSATSVALLILIVELYKGGAFALVGWAP